MKLYFAGSEFTTKELEKQKAQYALFSFFAFFRYAKNNETVLKRMQRFINDNYKQFDLFMDSGGYSAYSCGAKIDIDMYCDFCYKNRNKLKIYAQLDVIGNQKETMENLKYMESKKLNPLPVFHYGSDYKILKQMIKKYDYIALGGLVPYARQKPKLIKHLDNCFSIIKNNCKVHGFGMTGLPTLLRYPFYSVDSTSWIGGGKRGEYQQFKNGKLIAKRMSDVNNINFDNIECMVKGKKDGSWRKRLLNSIEEWIKVEKYVNKIWSKRGIIYD